MGEEIVYSGGTRVVDGIKKSQKNRPLISIITIVYNGEKHIEDTIKSVINQTYDHIEYIIIDGGSTDKCIDIIKKYEDYIDYWISEKDNGISDAFNKGIRVANGKWIGIINADDWYESDSCENIIKYSEYDFIFGSIRYWDGDRSYIDIARPEMIYDDMRINHPTLFVKRSLYQEVGLYDEKYKIAMDYDLVLRLFLSTQRYKNIDSIISNMRVDGVSQKEWTRSKKEARDIKIAHGISRYEANRYLIVLLLKRYILRLLQRCNLHLIHKLYRIVWNRR
jgi:glycosyltransferase involved in cell wall biosynthesis